MSRSNKVWAVIILFLIIVIVAGSILIWSKYKPSQKLGGDVQGEVRVRHLSKISHLVAKPAHFAHLFMLL